MIESILRFVSRLRAKKKEKENGFEIFLFDKKNSLNFFAQPITTWSRLSLNLRKNKTGLQQVLRPVKQVPLFRKLAG